MDSLEARRRTFDTVADLYDRLRPGYPEQLIEDVVRLSAIPPRGRILEIGCGPGKATVPFARRGYRITALEPGPHLAAIARRHVADHPDVAIAGVTFEEWEPPAADPAFDLVIAAQSFHFIDTGPGLAKAARLLRTDGALAIFGNEPLRGDSPLDQRLQQAYARHAPDLPSRHPDSALEDDLDASGGFGTVLMSRYRWSFGYSADDYAGLMATQSHHCLLPDAARSALLDAIREAIREFGGAITIDYVTHLHFARRRTG